MEAAVFSLWTRVAFAPELVRLGTLAMGHALVVVVVEVSADLAALGQALVLELLPLPDVHD